MCIDVAVGQRGAFGVAGGTAGELHVEGFVPVQRDADVTGLLQQGGVGAR
jgi:hypothetical protein